MKVLVADDSPTTRFALKKSLVEWGYEVVEADNGEDAWRFLIKKDPPRIAVLDWMMPKVDGVEICRRLQEQEESPFVYTILLTAKSDPEDLVFGLENGAHNFQSKPYSPVELRSHISVGRRLVEADDKIKEYAARMELLATTDSLTGIFNRRHFLSRADQEFIRSRRYHRPLSVILIDVDHFKNVNDRYGHAMGDEALKALTTKCREIMRENDLFGRFGGEEFAVVLPENDGPAAMKAAERIRRQIEKFNIEFDEKQIHITVSIGVTTLKPVDTGVESMINRADKALYRAKAAGRNCVDIG